MDWTNKLMKARIFILKIIKPPQVRGSDVEAIYSIDFLFII